MVLEEADNKSLETDNSGILIQSVAQNPGAIGYVALPYLIKDSSVIPSLSTVAPTLENTYNGTYSVWGYEHIYAAAKNRKRLSKPLSNSSVLNMANGLKNLAMA